MSKAKGSRNERKAVRVLEAAGYSCTKAGGSLGLFDVIAIRSDSIRLLQVKSNRNAPPHEREQIELFKVPEHCSKEIWIWYDYKRKPAITEIP